MLEKEYDVAISYTSIIEYLTWIVNEKVNAKKRIGWIHFDIRKIHFNHDFLLKLHKNMEKIYVVSNEGLQAFVSEFPVLKEKCELKYNVIDKTQILTKSTEKTELIKQDGVITILTLGRLSSEKGQDIIPDIALKLKETGKEFKWYIIGDGSLRTIIEEKISELNLEDCVILLGTKPNPYPYLKQADIYVQTSIHEGYCITLAEAKLFGMPIVSTDFAGAREQLDEIENGFVVKRNVNELYELILGNAFY
ncbi:MAG: glycosyltransferase [Ruminococcus sp.]|nr:glycosyltransferase [Ruminococcus sp.]